MKKIVLLGASNSVIPLRLNTGLSSVDGIELINLSIGTTDSLSKIRDIIANEDLLKKADLIILETNIIDVNNSIDFKLYDFHKLSKYIQMLYYELYKLENKILSLILPRSNQDGKDINSLHIQLCKFYGFNYIDMNVYLLNTNTYDFFISNLKDKLHQIKTIMQIFGANIAKNIDKFRYPKKDIKAKKQNISYKLVKAKDLLALSNTFHLKTNRGLFFKDEVCSIDKNTKLAFKKEYIGYKILGICVFNLDKNVKYAESECSVVVFKNKKTKIGVVAPFHKLFIPFIDDFIIDNETIITFNNNDKTMNMLLYRPRYKIGNINHFDLVDILLMKGEFEPDEIKESNDLQYEYNFVHLIPNLVFYKELIEDFLYSIVSNANIESLKRIVNEQKAPLENELSSLKNENTSLKESLNSPEQKEKILNIRFLEEKVKRKVLKNKLLEKDLGFTHEDILQSKILNQKVKDLEKLLSSIQRPQATIYTSAKARIHNHLAYKLGLALIENSKSIKGYIRLPYVLSYIKEKYKAEQKAYNDKSSKNPSLKLPPLASYPDYEAALKEKECLTYKLGLALMKADKSWYKGGYIKFYFESKRLKKEFKERQSKK